MKKLTVLCVALAGIAYADPPISFQTHYLPMGPQDGVYLVAPDARGNLFVIESLSAQASSFRIVKTDPDGNPLGSFDIIGQGYPTSAVCDPGGNLFVSSGSTITKVDIALTHTLASFSLGPINLGSLGVTNIRALAVDASGNLYATGDTHDKNFPVATRRWFRRSASRCRHRS